MEMLDARLADSEFVAGDTYTLADITALVTVDMAAWIKLPVPASCEHLKRWHDAVSARPSANT